MARIDKIVASGTIGNVIFYEWKGLPCARSKPANVRQSSGTRQASQRFGSSKTLSRLLRQAFSPLLVAASSRPVMYCFDRNVMPWLQAITTKAEPLVALEGFATCSESDPRLKLRHGVTTLLENNQVKVQLPALNALHDVVHPPKATQAQLSFAVTAIQLQQQTITGTTVQGTTIDFASPVHGGQNFHFDLPAGPGMLIAVAFSLRYFAGEPTTLIPVTDHHWMSTAVLQGWYRVS